MKKCLQGGLATPWVESHDLTRFSLALIRLEKRVNGQMSSKKCNIEPTVCRMLLGAQVLN